MKGDFAYKTANVDELTYHPEYREIGKLKIKENFKGLKSVTDFDSHNNLALKTKKKRKDKRDSYLQSISGIE